MTASKRRHFVEGCRYCESERARHPEVDPRQLFMPSHDPSPRCQSGGRPHCTCDTCF